jgi:hypothetical protein
MFLLQVVADTVVAVTPVTTGTELVSYLVSLAVGTVLGYTVKLLENAKNIVVKLSEPLKLVIIAVLSFGAAKLGTLLGVPVVGNPLDWNPEIVSAILTAAAALGLRASGVGNKK